MKMLVFLFPLYLFALTSRHHYENVYQVLDARGFNGKGILFCQLRIGETVKGIRQDPQNLLETLKRSKIVGKISPIPIYTIYLENGSWPWEKITISTDRSGDGYVEYLGRRVAFFRCADLPKFCEEAFKRSNTIVH
jgi:hypothetical protein